MSDVRSLLKAKRQETRITHPYATYTSSSQLKCSICNLLIKHASAWEGHLGSKAHRTAVGLARARQQQQEQEMLEAAAAAASLNDHEEDDEDEEEMRDENDADGERGQRTARKVQGKRKASITEQDLEAKKRKLGGGGGAGSGFPADFFSDPTRELPQPDDDDDNEAEDAMAVDSTASASAPKTVVDEEYEQFQRELLSMQSTTTTAPALEKHEAFARATVAVDEELFTEQQKSGFNDFGSADSAEQQQQSPEEETEEQKRQRREREDRELIMDRLLEEERLQEDADIRVATTKARVEALKRKREQRKAQRTTPQDGTMS